MCCRGLGFVLRMVSGIFLLNVFVGFVWCGKLGTFSFCDSGRGGRSALYNKCF